MIRRWVTDNTFTHNEMSRHCQIQNTLPQCSHQQNENVLTWMTEGQIYHWRTMSATKTNERGQSLNTAQQKKKKKKDARRFVADATFVRLSPLPPHISPPLLSSPLLDERCAPLFRYQAEDDSHALRQPADAPAAIFTSRHATMLLLARYEADFLIIRFEPSHMSRRDYADSSFAASRQPAIEFSRMRFFCGQQPRQLTRHYRLQPRHWLMMADIYW